MTPIDVENRKVMNEHLQKLEGYLNADVFVFFGELIDGIEGHVKFLIEDLNKPLNKKDTDSLYVLLTTPGGSLNPVKRIVNIFRHFYKEVYFVVPDYAYSAGTVLCTSGDKIYMSYYSALGPIDPQVKNKEGKFVAALGYLDKIEELVKKAQKGIISQAEFLILKDFDLAELRAYEQARDLAVDLLREWLPQYKFKDWKTHHSTGNPVTLEEKISRAEEIAQNLSDNKEWKSHGRPINIQELAKLKLQIDDFGTDKAFYDFVTNYHEMMVDYIRKYSMNVFFHTRRFL